MKNKTIVFSGAVIPLLLPVELQGNKELTLIEKLLFAKIHYLDGPDGCYAKNKKSFSGTCDNMGKTSGLLIVIPDELDRPLTNISVGLKEIKN